MSKGEAGFSITECVMALVVLSAASIGLLEALPKARQNASEASDRSFAATLALQIIKSNELGEAIVSGSDASGRFHWRTEVVPMGQPYRGQMINVRVSWEARGEEQEYTVRSYSWADQ